MKLFFQLFLSFFAPVNFLDDLHLCRLGAGKTANAWFDERIPVLSKISDTL